MDFSGIGKNGNNRFLGRGENCLVFPADINDQLAVFAIELGKDIVEEEYGFLRIGFLKIINLTQTQGENC